MVFFPESSFSILKCNKSILHQNKIILQYLPDGDVELLDLGGQVEMIILSYCHFIFPILQYLPDGDIELLDLGGQVDANLVLLSLYLPNTTILA